MITEEDRERVRQATDFVGLVSETVQLRQRGHDFWGCCPFHHEKTPSFHINPSTGLWNCFGCHKGGDLFDYVMARENVDFVDAVRYLADRAGIELSEERGASRGPKRSRLIEALDQSEEFFTNMLLRSRVQGSDEARAYLASRSFGSALCRRWGIGFAPGRGMLVARLRERGFTPQEMISADLAVERSGTYDGSMRLNDRFFNRVMFPIRDERGRVVGCGGRVIGDGKPKYLNTKETSVFHKSKHLFGLDRAKEAITASAQAIVCEGYTDVIALHEAGFKNAVAALGTALSLDHVRLLERFGARDIVCMFDGDAAGQKAAELSVQHLDKTRAEMRCVVLPDNLDPAEFIEARGPEALVPIVEEAKPLMSFVFDRRLQGYDLSIPGQRVAALQDAAQVLVPLANSVLLDSYVNELAARLHVNADAARRAVSAQAARRSSDEGSREAAASAPAYQPRESHASSPGIAALSMDERMLLAVERELCCMLAGNADLVRPYADRIAALSWADSRYESMAWAMLATPAGTSPAGVVAAASAVVPEAPRMLAGARLAAVEDMTESEKVAFLVDVVELHSTRRRIRELRAQMAEGATTGDDTLALLKEATELQRYCATLEEQLTNMSMTDING